MEPKWVQLPQPLVPLAENIAYGANAQVSRRNGTARIALNEVYHGQAVRSLHHPVLLRVDEGHDQDWERLAQLPDHSSLLGNQASGLRAKAAQAVQEYAESPTLLGLLRTFRLLVSLLEPRELPTTLRQNLQAWTTSEFPNATLHMVKVDSHFAFRLRLPQMATGMVTFPELAIPEPLAEPRFQSLEGLASREALLGGAPFLQPLLLATAPIMHSVMASRVGCSFILDLDMPIDGNAPEPTSLIGEFLPAYSDRRATSLPPQSAKTSMADRVAARDWWISRLNELFEVVTNPARFADNGEYVPAVHLATVIGVFNIFEYVSHLRVRAGRDALGRRLTCFTALDTFEGLNYTAAAALLNPDHARKTLAEVEAKLPEGVGRVLLPVSRRAVNYLAHHRSGFFIPSWQGKEEITLPGDNQSQKISRLVAEQLRATRNGHHSFRKLLQPGTNDHALLTAHTGHFADPIADLPMLYLLHILLDPQRILPSRLRDRKSRV
ncbi:hypothetical protein [Amycolatopsis sp. NPDC051371]|uniref:hypothetical protein n=1 Tax=Amycolatopsis sp. NPDC051371 TaxID=3155800 RepID=UPI0034382BCE